MFEEDSLIYCLFRLQFRGRYRYNGMSETVALEICEMKWSLWQTETMLCWLSVTCRMTLPELSDKLSPERFLCFDPLPRVCNRNTRRSYILYTHHSHILITCHIPTTVTGPTVTGKVYLIRTYRSYFRLHTHHSNNTSTTDTIRLVSMGSIL